MGGERRKRKGGMGGVKIDGSKAPYEHVTQKK
jgi:hypothetical protein